MLDYGRIQNYSKQPNAEVDKLAKDRDTHTHHASWELQPTTTQNRIISKRTGRNQKENDNKKELRLQPNILNHDQTYVAQHIRTQKDTEEAVCTRQACQKPHFASRSLRLTLLSLDQQLQQVLLSPLSLVPLLCVSFVSYLWSLCHGKCIIDLLLNPDVNPVTVLNGKKSCIDSSGNPRRWLWRRRNQQAEKNYLEPVSYLSLALWCGVEKQNFSPVNNSLDDSSSDQYSFQGARGGAMLCSHRLAFPWKRLATFFFSFELFFGSPLGCCCCFWRSFLVKREPCAAT